MIRLFNVKNWISFRKEAYPKDDQFNRVLKTNLSKIANYLEEATLFIPNDNGLVNLVRGIDIAVTNSESMLREDIERSVSFISATNCSSVLYSEPNADYPTVNLSNDGKPCRVYDIGSDLYNQAMGLSYPTYMDLSSVVISVDPIALHREYKSSGLDYTTYVQRYIMYRLIVGMFYVALFKTAVNGYRFNVVEEGFPFSLISLERHANGFSAFYGKLLTKREFTFISLLGTLRMGNLSCLDMLSSSITFNSTKDYFINISKYMSWLEELYILYPNRTLDNLMRVELTKTMLSLNMTKASKYKITLKGILDGTFYRRY